MPEHHYWRVIVTYSDGGNRVFKDREKAEEWATRQKKSPVVKKAVLEPFVRQQYAGRGVFKHFECERYVNRILREAFGQAKCIRSLNSLSASRRVADPERSAI
jgi:hypothetical protein